MADLKTIIHLTHQELKRQTSVEAAVLEVIEALKGREAEVLKRRYGLTQEKGETLQEIGQQLGITRERVRQIEKAGLRRFGDTLGRPPLSELVRLAADLVREHGGLISQEALYSEFLPAVQATEGGRRALGFLLEQAPGVSTIAESKDFAGVYATSPAHQQAAAQITPLLEKRLTEAKQPLSASNLLETVTADPASEGVRYLLNEAFVESTLEASRKFVGAPDDTWGLATWPEINPRNIRDKTLYVMRQVGTPLHFKDITAKIVAAHFDRKNVTMQAVHNELINGQEFVLIGRGIYALAEWGYLPGTVAEVITAVLTQAGSPLDREEIISEVLKQRHVSRNTILINLQEKGSFKRTTGQAYTLVQKPDEA